MKKRADHGYRYLLTQIDGLSAEEALAGSRPDWPDHRWGIGQNGSIAGIVYHVAAWKQMTLPLFQPGGRPLSREDFDADSAPALDDWAGIQAWLKQAGMAWSAELAALPTEAFDTVLTWEGITLTVAKFVAEMYEHDIQHAAQIEYLRQLTR
ncbi:MAG: hypothetical protein JWL77_6120 [Chthonomonadaceae bacterium]|nr:hypothetical protein [Chthonomonadaceae bacterium]